MIDREDALRIAAREMRQGPVIIDPLFAPWRAASTGEPVLVYNLWKQPSYWLVPVVSGGRVIGFIRLLDTGAVSALGAYYRDPGQLENCPGLVTGIDAAEAAREVVARWAVDQGETALEPIYVHDGPPGREAWLVEILRDGRPVRWIFVTPAFVYERPAGSELEEGLE